MVGLICGLCVLCIAVSCVALWYRGKWRYEKRRQLVFYYDIKEKYNKLKYENARTLQEIGALNIEIGNLRSKLPKRDSKGRYCKK